MEVIQYQKECLCLTYDLVNRQALAHKCDFCTNNNPKYQIFGIVKILSQAFAKQQVKPSKKISTVTVKTLITKIVPFLTTLVTQVIKRTNNCYTN